MWLEKFLNILQDLMLQRSLWYDQKLMKMIGQKIPSQTSFLTGRYYLFQGLQRRIQKPVKNLNWRFLQKNRQQLCCNKWLTALTQKCTPLHFFPYFFHSPVVLLLSPLQNCDPQIVNQHDFIKPFCRNIHTYFYEYLNTKEQA